MDDKTLLTVIDKFGASDIGELEYNDGKVQLILRKEAGSSPLGGQSPAGKDSPSKSTTAKAASEEASPKASSDGEEITSPIVGTFYRSSSPDAKPFVKEGQKVKAGETLCILEAMKMMNHLEAEFDCEILSVLAQNGDLVEYGERLFEVRRI